MSQGQIDQIMEVLLGLKQDMSEVKERLSAIEPRVVDAPAVFEKWKHHFFIGNAEQIAALLASNGATNG